MQYISIFLDNFSSWASFIPGSRGTRRPPSRIICSLLVNTAMPKISSSKVFEVTHSSKIAYNNANVLCEESLTATDTFTVVDLERIISRTVKRTTLKKKKRKV